MIGTVFVWWMATYLGMTNGTDCGTVLLHLVEVSPDLLLASIIVPLLGSLGERLLLAAVP